MAVTEKTHGSVKKVVWTWISDDQGDASEATTGALDGDLLGLTTVPAGGGSAPTDNYDITITDSDGHDVLLGAGADRDTSNTEHVARASLAGVSGSPLTLTVANAGDTKSGTVVLYVR